MATTARDEIIAQWRNRLADAEEPLSADSPRTAWLTRVKLRLYRFLLSLYGNGEWNAPEADATNSKDSGRIVIADDSIPLSGKPAKDENQIRAVLQSVAKASVGRAKPGRQSGWLQRKDFELFERGGALAHHLSLACMVASICVLLSVCMIHANEQTLVLSPAGQQIIEWLVFLAVGFFVVSAMMYGMFAIRPGR